jgi:hypothetical protein
MTYIQDRLVLFEGVFVTAPAAQFYHESQDNLNSLQSGYFWMRHCEACVYVYDVGNKTSFDSIRQHHENFLINLRTEQPHCALGCSPTCGANLPPYQGPIFVIANKIDLDETKWEVSTQEGQEYCNAIRATFIQMSAKTGEGGGTSIMKAIANRIMMQRVYCNSITQVGNPHELQ